LVIAGKPARADHIPPDLVARGSVRVVLDIGAVAVSVTSSPRPSGPRLERADLVEGMAVQRLSAQLVGHLPLQISYGSEFPVLLVYVNHSPLQVKAGDIG